jgi:hypothetical protein
VLAEIEGVERDCRRRLKDETRQRAAGKAAGVAAEDPATAAARRSRVD